MIAKPLVLFAAAGLCAALSAPAAAQSLGVSISAPIDRGFVSVGVGAPLAVSHYGPAHRYGPPPPPTREIIPYLPPHHVWDSGYWRLGPQGYYWVQGRSRYVAPLTHYAPPVRHYSAPQVYYGQPAVSLNFGWSERDRRDWNRGHGGQQWRGHHDRGGRDHGNRDHGGRGHGGRDHGSRDSHR